MAKKKIDIVALQHFVTQYKKTFAQRRLGEIYKWEAIKCFQENWNIEAPDFPAMLKRALEKTNNLLVSANSYPRRMLEGFTNKDPEIMRGLFRALFDESVDVIKRVKAFEDGTTKLLETDSTLHTYQNPNSISTYLWLRYPDKYYIYKYSVIRANAQTLRGGDLPTDKFDRMVFTFDLYDTICEELAKDTDLVSMSRASLTGDCYPDKELKTLTVDVCYFISQYKAMPALDGSQAVTAQMRDKNIILYGPPGTGKLTA
jgi:5-methylcytosine-specific restriction protein B